MFLQSGLSLTMWSFVSVCLPGEEPIDELTMERTMEALERQCHDNMKHAIETVEGLGIEYDEDVICDVCRSPDSEEGNDMVFCDKCNICVHQVNMRTPFSPQAARELRVQSFDWSVIIRMYIGPVPTVIVFKSGREAC